MVTPVIAQHALRFASGDGECDASLFLPHGTPTQASLPIVVIAHGLAGSKSQRLGDYARKFADRGYAALTFDYRHFGSSTGEPRQLVDLSRQLEDWTSAVAFVRTLDQVDPHRVVLWGTSFAGGHVMVTAAVDRDIAAAIVQCPFSDGMVAARAMPKMTSLKLMARALKDRSEARKGRAPVRVPIVGAPGEVAIMSSPDSVEGLRAIFEASGEPFDIPQIPARFMFQVPGYRPGLNAEKITAPLLVCVCVRDKVTPARITEKLAARAVNGEVRRYDVGHFEIYVGSWFERLSDDQVEFLERHVPLSVPAVR